MRDDNPYNQSIEPSQSYDSDTIMVNCDGALMITGLNDLFELFNNITKNMNPVMPIDCEIRLKHRETGQILYLRSE